MDRKAKAKIPWRLHTHRSGLQYVRFRHAGHDYDRSCKTHDPITALGAAQEIYDSVVSGRAPRIKGATSLGPLTDAWLREVRGRRITDDTAAIYGGYARQWADFFETLEQVTTERARQYAYMRADKVLRKTIRKELSALRMFLKWCHFSDRLPVVPLIPLPDPEIRGVRVNPERKRTGRLLTVEEVPRLLAVLPEKGKRGGRPQDFFTLLYELPLRPVTIGRLELGRHWSKGGRTVWVEETIDKIRYERHVPLTKKARQALARASLGLPEGAIIFGHHDWRKTLSKAARKAKIKGSVTDYDLRHSRATHLAESGANMPGLSFILGHLQITTTNRYVKPSEAAARAALKGEV